MKNRKERSFEKAFVMRPAQLQSLLDALDFRQEDLQIRIKCKDGSTLYPASTEALFALPNPKSRAIQKIAISGKLLTGTAVELDLEESELTPMSYECSGVDADVVRVSQIIEDRYEPMMQSFSWISVGRTSFAIGFGLFLFGVLLAAANFQAGLSPHPTIRMTMIAVGALFGWLGLFGEGVRQSIFPIASFCIGDGTERYEKALGWRKNMFWVVAIGFVLSVLGGLFANSLSR